MAGQGTSGAHDATATKREAQKRDKFGAPLNYGPYRNGYYVGGDKPKREVEEAVSNGVAAELQAIVQQVNRADAAPPQRVAAAVVAPPRRAQSKRPVAAAAAAEERRIDAADGLAHEGRLSRRVWRHARMGGGGAGGRQRTGVAD